MANTEASSGAFVVRRLAAVYAGAAPGANTNVFTAVTPSPNCCAMRLTICLTTGSKVDVQVTDGTTAYSQTLNNNTALTAACLYTFTFGVAATKDGTTALSYSIRYQTDSITQILLLDEVTGPVT